MDGDLNVARGELDGLGPLRRDASLLILTSAGGAGGSSTGISDIPATLDVDASMLCNSLSAQASQSLRT